jgi:hypothetical protein
MASAYEVNTNPDRANEAAAIMASHQRVRVFGEIGAEGPQRTPPEAMHTGQFIPPSLTANPESTINGSISSDANSYITDGSLDASAFVPPPGTVANTTTSPTAAAAFPTPNVAAGATTLTPAMSSVVIPSPNSAANLPLRSLQVTQTTTTTGTRTAITTGTATGNVVVPIRVSSANGAVTVTNMGASAPVAIKGK